MNCQIDSCRFGELHVQHHIILLQGLEASHEPSLGSGRDALVLDE